MHSRLIELEKEALFQGFQTSPLTQVFDSVLTHKRIELWIKRDDLIHPVISGNKWRKLKYILDNALTINSHTLVSMGGAYSNHLHALAFIGKQLDLKTIGYIRGEQPKNFSATLKDMVEWGMELRFVSRSVFRDLRQYKEHDQMPNLSPGEYWLAEGGSSQLALQGISEIMSELIEQCQFDCVCVPCGTATTLAGLINNAPNGCQLYGFSALKNAGFLDQEVDRLLALNNEQTNWSIQLDYHFGGFAKSDHQLLLFIENFEQKHKIKLDKVYTGKMFYGLFDLVNQGFFKSDQRIIAIHTGGLQGNRV